VFDLSAKRQLNQGFGNSLSAAVELVVSPLLMALLGWALDGWIGTTPVFTVGLFAFTLGYVAWKQYALYQQSMDHHERKLLGPKSDGADA
jgi:F0F1-type ATP synthase assembly protein I